MRRPFRHEIQNVKAKNLKVELPSNVTERREAVLNMKVWDLPIDPSSLGALFAPFVSSPARVDFPVFTLADRKKVTIRQLLPHTGFMKNKYVSGAEAKFIGSLRHYGLDLEFMKAGEGTQGDLPLDPAPYEER